MDVAVSAVPDRADASVDACVSTHDKAVHAFVETRNAFSVYDPPVESPPVTPPSAADVLETVELAIDQPGLPSASDTDSARSP